jgi:hypothetical protein
MALMGVILLLGFLGGVVIVLRGQKLGYFQGSLEEAVERMMMMPGINATGLLPRGRVYPPLGSSCIMRRTRMNDLVRHTKRLA